jgi:hypothetical protein
MISDPRACCRAAVLRMQLVRRSLDLFDLRLPRLREVHRRTLACALPRFVLTFESILKVDWIQIDCMWHTGVGSFFKLFLLANINVRWKFLIQKRLTSLIWNKLIFCDMAKRQS